MNFKVVYSDEIKRLPVIPESFASLKEAIKSAFKDSLVTDFVVQYQDYQNSDFKVIHSEGDFKQFMETNKNSTLKVFVQTTMYPVFIRDEELRAPVVEEPVKKGEVDTKDEQETPAKKEKREKSRKKHSKEATTAPVVSEAEAAIRAELLKKREDKKLKKAKVDELRTEVQDLKKHLTLLEMKKLENKGKLISLKKTKVFDEALTKEEAAKLRESKILIREELKPIKQEMHELKLKVHSIRNEVRELQGKEPKANLEVEKPSKCKNRERKCGKRIEFNENLQEELASPVTPGAQEPAGQRERVKSLSEVFPHVTKKFIRSMIRDNPTISDEQIAAALIQA